MTCHVARTIAELVSPKQLRALRKAEARAGIDLETWTKERYGCRPTEMTKAAASEAITELERAGRAATED